MEKFVSSNSLKKFSNEPFIDTDVAYFLPTSAWWKL